MFAKNVKLTQREHDVIVQRFGLDGRDSRTLEEIAQQYGVSRERIRQIEVKALRKLKSSEAVQKLRGFYDEL